MKAGNLKIGQILINSGDITEEQLDEVLRKQKESGNKKRIADLLIEDKIVTEQQVCKALEKQLFMPYVDLDTIQIPEELFGGMLLNLKMLLWVNIWSPPKEQRKSRT